MIAGDTDLDAIFKRLHLGNARAVDRSRFLTLLATEEVAPSANAARACDAPRTLSISENHRRFQLHLSVVAAPADARLGALAGLCDRKAIVDPRGKPGRGKAHLAIVAAYRAIQNGFDAFLTTTAALIDDLSAAFRVGELANALTTYTHPAVLVVDEVDHLTYGTDAATLLFQVVNGRYRRHRPDDLHRQQIAQSVGPRAPR